MFHINFILLFKNLVQSDLCQIIRWFVNKKLSKILFFRHEKQNFQTKNDVQFYPTQVGLTLFIVSLLELRMGWGWPLVDLVAVGTVEMGVACDAHALSFLHFYNFGFVFLIRIFNLTVRTKYVVSLHQQ